MDFSVGRALGLMARTAPYVALRAAVYFGIAFAYLFATGAGAGIGYGIGGFWGATGHANGAFWGGALGFGATAAALYLLREYILYVVKAGHVAVLVEMLDGQPLPEGRGQVAHGAAVVRARFAQASLLFGLDQLIKGVIRAITGLARGIADLLPLPGIQAAVGVFHAFLHVALGFVDEVILAHAIRTRSTNAWEAARAALVLYGGNSGAMMRNAAVLALVVYGLTFLIFLLALAPAAALVLSMPGGWSAAGVVFALVIAWAFKAALLEPFAVCCMMQAFFAVTRGQSPDPAWDARLSQVSEKFRELKERAFGAADADDTVIAPRPAAVPPGSPPGSPWGRP